MRDVTQLIERIARSRRELLVGLVGSIAGIAAAGDSRAKKGKNRRKNRRCATIRCKAGFICRRGKCICRGERQRCGGECLERCLEGEVRDPETCECVPV